MLVKPSIFVIETAMFIGYSFIVYHLCQKNLHFCWLTARNINSTGIVATLKSPSPVRLPISTLVYNPHVPMKFLGMTIMTTPLNHEIPMKIPMKSS